MGGLIVIVLGLWGALVPFVGPYFGYGFGTHATWHYTENRLWLDILPGAVAVVAGAIMLGAVTRRAGLLAGWLGLAAGAWFVVGPSLAITWEHGAVGPIGTPLGGHTRQMLEYVGFFYGLGGLIVALTAFASGRFFSRPLLAGEPVAVAAAYRELNLNSSPYEATRTTSVREPDSVLAHPDPRPAASPVRSDATADAPAQPATTAEPTRSRSQTPARGRRGWLREAMRPTDSRLER
jgi:hypothetical protein